MLAPRSGEANYPDTDGKPMAENTMEFELLVTLKAGIDALIQDFVAGALFWYPVQGHPERDHPLIIIR